MEKRTLIALALSFLVIAAWSKFFSPPAKQSTIRETQVVSNQSKQIEKNTTTVVAETYNIEQAKNVQLTDSVEIEFAADKDKGFVSQVKILGYKQPLPFGEVLKLDIGDKLLYNKELSSGEGLSLEYNSEKVGIIQTLEGTEKPYVFNSSIKLRNLTKENLNIPLRVTLGRVKINNNNTQDRFFEGSIIGAQNVVRFNLLGKQPVINFNSEIVGIKDRYFCFLVKPLFVGASLVLEKLDKSEARLGISMGKVNLASGEEKEYEIEYYFGPQITKYLGAFDPKAEQVINFGFIDPIGKGILMVLRGLHNIVKSWGLSIILLSGFLFLLTYPLTKKQMDSMKKMQLIQPEMEKIKVSCKDNPQKLQKETMELYKKYNINPLSGCLPMLLQIPLFFALYQALMRSIELYGAGFLWIKDLSEPDKTFLIGGVDINLLPIIMAVLMFFQQKLSQTGATGAMAEQQKMMLWMMPVMFGFIFYSFPSGLALYWLFNSIFSFSVQWKTLRK